MNIPSQLFRFLRKLFALGALRDMDLVTDNFALRWNNGERPIAAYKRRNGFHVEFRARSIGRSVGGYEFPTYQFKPRADP